MKFPDKYLYTPRNKQQKALKIGLPTQQESQLVFLYHQFLLGQFVSFRDGQKGYHRIHGTGIFTYIYHETQAFMLYANVPGNSANQRDLFGMVEFKT